jgi:hypothetical protein
MSGPFVNLIKSTTGSAPGSGAFTPNAAAPGFIGWGDSIWGVAAGWMGLVRFDDGTAWELRYAYWNGTTISRGANAFVTSSTGSALSLSAAATATLIPDGLMVQPHLGSGLARGYVGLPGATTTPSALGAAGVTVTGTAGTASIATTAALTERGSSQTASATTANAQAGYTTPILVTNNTTAERGGFEFTARFASATALPTGRRLYVGVNSGTFITVTSDPSAFTGHLAGFALDGSDTNLHLLTNSNAGGGTKIDTGIPFVQNGYYHAQIWMKPGGGRVYALLMRLDTGEIWFGTTTTDIPGTAALRGQILGWLGATTGTAFTVNLGAIMLRSGGM